MSDRGAKTLVVQGKPCFFVLNAMYTCVWTRIQIVLLNFMKNNSVHCYLYQPSTAVLQILPHWFLYFAEMMTEISASILE